MVEKILKTIMKIAILVVITIIMILAHDLGSDTFMGVFILLGVFSTLGLMFIAFAEI